MGRQVAVRPVRRAVVIPLGPLLSAPFADAIVYGLKVIPLAKEVTKQRARDMSIATTEDRGRRVRARIRATADDPNGHRPITMNLSDANTTGTR
jgi:hypothetical protein